MNQLESKFPSQRGLLHLLEDLRSDSKKRAALGKALPVFNQLRSQIDRLEISQVFSPRKTDGLQASYLTHELRAPVTAIRMGLEILQEQIEQRLGPDEKQLLSLAVRNTGRLQGLINDIMDYSKVMAGKMTLSKELCDGWELASEAVASLQPWATSKGVSLTMGKGSGLSAILVEPRRIIQVLTNLISNAIKFTPAGGCVVVSVEKKPGVLVFTVSDTGCGIPRDKQKSVFEAFEQSEAGGKKSEGTGLGLTLARMMVEAHGGRMWVESRVGVGSIFLFSIPLPGPARAARGPSRTRLRGLVTGLSRQLNALLAAILL